MLQMFLTVIFTYLDFPRSWVFILWLIFFSMKQLIVYMLTALTVLILIGYIIMILKQSWVRNIQLYGIYIYKVEETVILDYDVM